MTANVIGDPPLSTECCDDLTAGLADILLELQSGGGTVALDAPTLAALETITVGNMIPAVETGLATELTQAQVLSILAVDILNALQAIAIDADTIALDADTINLSTDQLENMMAAVRDRLPATFDSGSLRVAIQNWISTIDVGNMIPAVETNLAKTADITSFAAKVPDEEGTWDYYGGASGTVNVAAGERVIGIAAHATTAGTLTINGGDPIPIPANVGIDLAPRGNLIAPTLVLTGTDSYVVEVIL